MMNNFLHMPTMKIVDAFYVAQITGITTNEITIEHLNGTDFALLDWTDAPACEEWQVVRTSFENQDDGTYKVLHSIEDKSGIDLKSLIRRKIAEKRLSVEMGGVMYQGVLIPTDRNTQSVLTSMNLRSDRDPTYTEQFKVGEGTWITLDREKIVEIGNQVFNHVSWCFAREKELNALLDSGEDITEASW